MDKILIYFIFMTPLVLGLYLCSKLGKHQIDAMLLTSLVWLTALYLHTPKINN